MLHCIEDSSALFLGKGDAQVCLCARKRLLDESARNCRGRKLFMAIDNKMRDEFLSPKEMLEVDTIVFSNKITVFDKTFDMRAEIMFIREREKSARTLR
jgi:hypothetical protein